MDLLKTYLPLLILLLCSCSDPLFEHNTNLDVEDNFEHFWSVFDEKYGAFTERQIDWDDIYRRHRSLISESSNNKDLFNVLSSMLEELDDPHVTLQAPGIGNFKSGKNFRELEGYDLFSKSVIQTKYLNTTFSSSNLLMGTIDGHIGYLYIGSLIEPIEDLNRVINHLDNYDRIVIDLRHNGGGNFHHGFALVNALASEKRTAFTTITKTGPRPDDFSSKVAWVTKPNGIAYRGKLVVVVNNFTHSAAERTLFGLMTLPDVTLVGVNTSGAHGELIYSEMPNGWTYSYVPQAVFGPDGLSHEKFGIAPSIYVENNEEVLLGGVDNQLEAAINIVKVQ